ncbi:DEAD/DEAH box helicase [archaeon]
MLKQLGIDKLNPVQEEALATRFIENRANIVVSSPTGSGKTLVALLAALEAIKNGKKAVFTCPLKALASEHYDTFKKIKGIKVALSIGDLDARDPFLQNYDLIVTSYEKLDSLMRHKSKFIPDTAVLVADEIHLLDTNRGATLETIITRFRQLLPKCQIIALSATVPNAKEIADWLNAELVQSDWRPTKLVKGVYYENIIETDDETIEVSSTAKTPVLQLVADTIARDGQALVFVNTRKSAVAEARRIAATLDLKNDALAEKILSALESPTRQCKELAEIVRKGAAFHTAALVSEQRKLIENAFREGKIKAIAATPTLAMGVNTPADTVIVRDLSRYTENGLAPIPVREYLQMAGRAGRPNYSKEGLAVCVAKDVSDKDSFMSDYVFGNPEKVYSQLGFEPVLRTQLLASIAVGFTPSRKKLDEFLLNSFYAFQYGEIDSIKRKADSILHELEDWGFIEMGDHLLPTPLGRRVSELYLDPYSAFVLLKSMREREMGELGLLYMLTATDELRPYLRARSGEESTLWSNAHSNEKELGIDCVNVGFEDYNFLDKYKTTLLLRDWAEEVQEDLIIEKYGVAPGILRAKLSNWKWVAYAAIELAKLEHLPLKELRKAERRIKYGVRGELLPLVELKGIGRVRARKLFNASIKTIPDIEKTPATDLARVLGPRVAESVKKQLGEEVSLSTGKTNQSKLK